LFDGKCNLVSALGRANFKIPSSFQKCQEEQKKKLKKDGNLYAKFL